MSPLRRLGPLVVLALSWALASPGPAQATYDPIAAGTTTVRFDPAFLATLRASGVTLAATAPAKLKNGAVSFPVATGQLDPVAAKGTVQHEGALVFRRGRRKLPMKALQLKTTQRRSPLSAKFGGGKLKLSASARLATARAGFGLRAKVGAMLLSAKVATRLDKKLDLRGVFAEGDALGSAVSTMVPASVAIASVGRAELALDPAFAAKLQSLFVAVNPIAPAEHPGAFTFPVGGGDLAPNLSSGVLKTGGALEFIQVGGGQFLARDLEPDLGAHLLGAESRLVLASSGEGPNQVGPVFGLGAAPGSADPAQRRLSLSGAPLSLQPATAQAFNEAFAKPQGKEGVFAAGEVLGSLSFTAQGR
ncbi:MAG TPA: hypothetical protein VFJ65_10495 [Solirubrobacterales bacterium]|nr:hypothetical protein [Solirubrobacterales bacterium]